MSASIEPGRGRIGVAQDVILEVTHRTRYLHVEAAATSQHLIHLSPRDSQWQRVLAHRLDVDPAPDESVERRDWFGNPAVLIAIDRPHDRFVVDARSRVRLASRPSLAALDRSPAWASVAATLDAASRACGRFDAALLEPCQYLFDSPFIARDASLSRYASACFEPGRSLIDGACALMRKLHDEFTFDPKATDLSTPLDAVLRMRRGVCQDFAHLMIGCLRSLGLAARYVSGYVQTWRGGEQDRPMVGADASHAWVSVWCPVHGWTDFDPTNDCLVDREHITLAWGRDFSDVTPIRGVVLGVMQPAPQVAVTVRRILEDR